MSSLPWKSAHAAFLHTAVTAHPTAEWTIQQFRETLPFDYPYKFVLHDRDAIYSAQVDAMLKSSGLRVLKSPVRSPKSNAFCERLLGTIRRECLDFLIPLGERHLSRIVREWTLHYNKRLPAFLFRARHPGAPIKHCSGQGHTATSYPTVYRVTAKTVLGGLHHEYGLKKEAA